MEDLIKKVSYLKGYADGLDLSPKSDEGKLIIKLLDVMSEMADTIEELNSRVDDVEDVVDELDDCVLEIADDLYGDDEYDDYDDDDDDEDDDRRQHDVGTETLVAVADGKIAEAAAAEYARHGGIADKGDNRKGNAEHYGVQCFRQQNFVNNLHRACTHALCGFDNAVVNFKQRRFDNARNKRRCGNGKRHNGGRGADGRTNQHTGKRNNGYH